MRLHMKITDESIQQSVIDQVGSEDTLATSTIGVSVRDGVVHLTGVVGTRSDRSDAERAAARVAGVRSIVNDLDLASPAIR